MRPNSKPYVRIGKALCNFGLAAEGSGVPTQAVPIDCRYGVEGEGGGGSVSGPSAAPTQKLDDVEPFGWKWRTAPRRHGIVCSRGGKKQSRGGKYRGGDTAAVAPALFKVAYLCFLCQFSPSRAHVSLVRQRIPARYESAGA